MRYNIIAKVSGFVNTFFAFWENFVFFSIYVTLFGAREGLDAQAALSESDIGNAKNRKGIKPKARVFDNIRLHFAPFWATRIEIEVAKSCAFYG
jgi:hypothetical protein